jgi:tripartite-type tricarboxylate transporter receptor subunit TctC
MPAPDSDTSTIANRRTFLKSAGITAVGTVFAGCLGGDGDGGDGSGDGDGDGGSTPTAMPTTADPSADYPSDDIDFIVPYATGGGFDAYSRLLKPYLEEELGVTVNVQNVTGGGGVVGATQVWNAEPDGHTMMIWAPTEAAYKQIGLDVDFRIQDYSHIGYVTQDPNALTLMKSAGIDSWDGFVESIPELNFVTQGRGSSAHMLTVLLGGVTGAFDPEAPNFVHYGGTGEALGGLERGEGQAFTVGTASSAAKVVSALEANMFSVFASPDHAISDYMDQNDIDVQHYSTELGVDNMETYNDLTVFRRFVTGPPGVPDAIQAAQIEAFDAAVNNDDLIQEGIEAARPFIDPVGSADRVSGAIETTFDSLGSEPYRSIIQDALSG